MAATALFFAFAAALSAAYGYYVGRARAARTRVLWQGLKQANPDAIGVVLVVAGIMIYVLVSYEPPLR